MDKLLESFILEPGKEFHIRELAKRMKKSPTTVSKYLAKYEKEGLLKSRKKFNHILFQANLDSSIFHETKLSYNLKMLRESGLINSLIDNYNHPEAIILFGSFAKAEDVSRSDIDIFVVTSIKKEIDLSIFEKKLKHPIQLFAHSRSEIEKMKIKNKELLNNLINGVVLDGYWQVFR